MKQISLVLIVALMLGSSAILSPAKADADTNPAYSILGTLVALPTGMLIESTKQSIEYGKDTANAIDDMDVHEAYKPLMMVLGVPLSVPFGWVSGIIDGSANALEHGFNDPFSKASFSVEDEYRVD